MGRGERITAAVFLATAVAWVTQPLLGSFIPAWTDTSIALTAALALFLLPIGGPERRGVLTWDEAESKLPWGVLLLFGGGLSLAAAINESGLAEWIAQALGPLGARSSIALIAALVAAVILLSEVATNTAAAATVLPLAAAMAGSEHLSPLAYAAPAVLAASCGFMLPVATPPNTIVYATGRVPIRDMVRAGCALDLFGLAVVTAVGAVLVASAPS
jgi:sodium-dependent dicarboxylate transporter 2/3/5